MVDELSMKRIIRHSETATKILKMPAVMMIGPMTRAQETRKKRLETMRRNGKREGNQIKANRAFAELRDMLDLNFRLHVFTGKRWVNLGGHCDREGQFSMWNDWTPDAAEWNGEPIRWNDVGLRTETTKKITKAIATSIKQAAVAPIFIKVERDTDAFDKLVAHVKGGETSEKSDGDTDNPCHGTDAPGVAS